MVQIKTGNNNHCSTLSGGHGYENGNRGMRHICMRTVFHPMQLSGDNGRRNRYCVHLGESSGRNPSSPDLVSWTMIDTAAEKNAYVSENTMEATIDGNLDLITIYFLICKSY